MILGIGGRLGLGDGVRLGHGAHPGHGVHLGHGVGGPPGGGVVLTDHGIPGAIVR